MLSVAADEKRQRRREARRRLWKIGVGTACRAPRAGVVFWVVGVGRGVGQKASASSPRTMTSWVTLPQTRAALSPYRSVTHMARIEPGQYHT